VYTPEILARCLNAAGYAQLAGTMDNVSRRIQSLRWRMRFATGYDPEAIGIPARFSEITTWKGRLDAEYLVALKSAYARRIFDIAGTDISSRPPG
jgi:aldehyde:ferredoxin oxidoreductase